jgi:GTP-binding protein
MSSVVAIVGRPNVGKSTLFNKLVKGQKAITLNKPGVTRDLNYGEVKVNGNSFTLVDTGGFEITPLEGSITAQVKRQAQVAIEEADIIVFLMDGREGLSPEDEDLASLLRKAEKPVIYCVNKIDNPQHEPLVADFYKIGVEQLIPISAEHKKGIDQLLDEIEPHLSPAIREKEDEGITKIAILGRPNVGKSTLVNKLVGYERVIVSPLPGTTRDSIDTAFKRDDKNYLIVDTAGMRRKSKISLKIEQYSIFKAIKSLEKCDVAVLLIDPLEGVTAQDVKIASLIKERGKGCIIAVNKWDLVKKDAKTIYRYEEKIREKISFMDYAPILFVSVLFGKRVSTILDLVDEIGEGLRTRVQTANLNNILENIKKRKQPPLYRGRELKLYYLTQVSTRPPTFIVFANYPQGVKENYKRYLASTLREGIALPHTPIRVLIKGRK